MQVTGRETHRFRLSCCLVVPSTAIIRARSISRKRNHMEQRQTIPTWRKADTPIQGMSEFVGWLVGL
jgi:hypothetical protein